MNLLRKILFPFVPFYYLATWLRNRFYDFGVFKSKSYSLPVICIGNLSVGGTGKTPMVEYVVKQLKPEFKLATLSRGYGRKTNGFIVADADADAERIGDEPLQFYKKFSDITVAVDTDRQHGISELMKKKSEVIILDDAFQHRKVKAGLNILLTTYDNPFFLDYVLPTGNLREPRSGYKRADVIMVTKCPESLDEMLKKDIVKRIKPYENQKVFFSHIQYGDTILSAKKQMPLLTLKDSPFVLVTGIANANPLVRYLKNQNLKFEHLNFKDHHDFSASEIELLKGKDFVLTTEKDYMRLQNHIDDLFYLPIETRIDNADEFNSLIKAFVTTFKTQ